MHMWCMMHIQWIGYVWGFLTHWVSHRYQKVKLNWQTKLECHIHGVNASFAGKKKSLLSIIKRWGKGLHIACDIAYKVLIKAYNWQDFHKVAYAIYNILDKCILTYTISYKTIKAELLWRIY